MKTIDINLIGERLTKKYAPTQEDIDEKSKLISIVILSSTMVIFLICCSVWLLSAFMIKKTNNEITELNARQDKLDVNLKQSTSVFKDMKQEKTVLGFELLVQNQVNNGILPWHSILVEISKAVPKNIKITKINKSSSESDTKSEISISGEVSSNVPNPLDMISYFVLNINNNPYLTKAIIKNVDFDKKGGKYTFSITSELKVLQNAIQEKKE